MKKLPVSSKRLLALGIILALFVALPLFIWGVVTQKFDIREKAQTRDVVEISGEPSVGPDDAVVTIVEFGDLQCPFCKTFAENTLPQILSTYPDTVKFVFKDFPLTAIHPLAQKASIAAECAFSQDKFWEMHDLIYANQDTLEEASFASFSAQLSLDTTAFLDCYNNESPLFEIDQDYAEGQNLGVNGTPTFFINGIKVEGAVPFETISSTIDSEIALSAAPSSTSSPTDSPTVSPTQSPYVEGAPNSCGGTCGSNYNCQAELYCHNGYCRNPYCPDDYSCGCETTTPKPTSKPTSKSTVKATRTPEIAYYTPESGILFSTLKPTPSPTTKPTFAAIGETAGTTSKKTDWVFVGILASLGGSVILTIWAFIRAFKKPNIPEDIQI